ncbi:hypothetical protein LCGC14_0790910 [marine sediment metagenome]|uniref:Uncharacterized protein n=1 Tax=marine sediment metagenome TaxID=412755 RepID=A0A0F9PWW7_9ZZZZ
MSIQFALQRELDRRGHRFILPNVLVDWGEADMLSITQAGYMHEWEIKVRRDDFYADFKKNKHMWLEGPMAQEPGGRCTASSLWYVMPEGLVPQLDVPDYAGLVFMIGRYGVSIMRNAPKLHQRKVGEYQMSWLLRIAAIKLWSVKRELRNAKSD